MPDVRPRPEPFTSRTPSKPLTAAFGLTDSPAALAAWIVEK